MEMYSHVELNSWRCTHMLSWIKKKKICTYIELNSWKCAHTLSWIHESNTFCNYSSDMCNLRLDVTLQVYCDMYFLSWVANIQPQRWTQRGMNPTQVTHVTRVVTINPTHFHESNTFSWKCAHTLTRIHQRCAHTSSWIHKVVHTHWIEFIKLHTHIRLKYGVATSSRLLQIIGLFYKRAL